MQQQSSNLLADYISGKTGPAILKPGPFTNFDRLNEAIAEEIGQPVAHANPIPIISDHYGIN